MSKIMWNPETGEHDIFGPNKTPPPHWIDHHPADTAKTGKAPAADPGAGNPVDMSGGLTKAEIAEALKAGGVEFNPSDNKAVLTEQLIVALKHVLTEREIAFDENETAHALLDKVTAPTE